MNCEHHQKASTKRKSQHEKRTNGLNGNVLVVVFGISRCTIRSPSSNRQRFSFVFCDCGKWCKTIPLNPLQLVRQRQTTLSNSHQQSVAVLPFPLFLLRGISIINFFLIVQKLIIMEIRTFFSGTIEQIQLGLINVSSCSCSGHFIGVMSFLQSNSVFNCFVNEKSFIV